VVQTLKNAGPNATIVAGSTTAIAIQSLGPDATPKQVAAIVFAAVRAVPDSALNIVRAAVAVAPNDAPQIAAAAARAVPNPWKEVRYAHPTPGQPGRPGQPDQTPPGQPAVTSSTLAQNQRPAPSNREPDFKSPPVDHSLASAGNTPNPVLDPAAAGDPMSLAEAIVQAAVDAHAGVDPAAVQAAVDAALFGDPSTLFNSIADPKGISGVGEAGNSNIANEPILPGPPKPPGQPPVSQ
jgi:hypothetical protein